MAMQHDRNTTRITTEYRKLIGIPSIRDVVAKIFLAILSGRRRPSDANLCKSKPL